MTLKLSYPYLLGCLACAACMATSCSTDTQDIPVVGEGCEVTFDVKDPTRATATSSFDHFAVYGDMKYTEVSNAEPTVIFDKTLVEHSNGTWSYKDAQYWYPNHEHSFVAVYPLSVLETDNNPQYSDSRLSFTYTLPLTDEGVVNHEDVTDIVAATYRRLYTIPSAGPSSATPVLLQFTHLLSQINFSLELGDPSVKTEEYIKIHKLEMSGFGNTAAINIKPAPRLDNPQTNDSEVDIVTAKGNGSLEISFDEPIEVINGATAIKMFDDNNAIIMLPQTFAANEALQIRLTYSTNDETETTQVIAYLSGFTWEWGKSYNYKIKLELKEAKMVISEAPIAPWNLIDDHDQVDAR